MAEIHSFFLSQRAKNTFSSHMALTRMDNVLQCITFWTGSVPRALSTREPRIHNGNVLRACQPKSVFLVLQSTKEDKNHFKFPFLMFPTPCLVEISFCHDPDFSCSVISYFISKLCRHVLLFSSFFCVISLHPVFFFRSFPSPVLRPPASTCTSSPH